MELATGTTKVGVRGAENQGGCAHRVQVDQGAKLGVANARNAANSADGHRSYALADTESDSHKEETISKTSASLHVGLIRVGCFFCGLCGSSQCRSRLCGSSFDQCHATASS